jgi:hypothetical protein
MPKFQVEDFIADLEPVDYDTGFWCRRCLLPSGVRIVAMITIGVPIEDVRKVMHYVFFEQQ